MARDPNSVSRRDPESKRSKEARVDVGRQRIRKGAPPNRRDKGTLTQPWADTTRDRIRVSKLLPRLLECAEGTTELSPVQARVSLGLLDKILPTLTESKTEHSGEIIVERHRITDPDTNT